MNMYSFYTFYTYFMTKIICFNLRSGAKSFSTKLNLTKRMIMVEGSSFSIWNYFSTPNANMALAKYIIRWTKTLWSATWHNNNNCLVIDGHRDISFDVLHGGVMGKRKELSNFNEVKSVSFTRVNQNISQTAQLVKYLSVVQRASLAHIELISLWLEMHCNMLFIDRLGAGAA